jgi:hypothetical protein
MLSSVEAENESGYACFMVVDDDRERAAKKLHTKVYLSRGYLAEHQVDNDGIATEEADPHQQHSQYFIATKRHESGLEEVVATARQIISTSGMGHKSFQTIAHQKLYKSAEEYIHSLDHRDCVEISGLAKERSTPTFVIFMLYRQMWHYSIMSKHWIMSCDEKLLARLSFLFGEAFTQIGDMTFYKGHNVVPVAIDIGMSLDSVINSARTWNPFMRVLRKKLINYFLYGLSFDYLTPQQQKELVSLGIVRTSDR